MVLFNANIGIAQTAYAINPYKSFLEGQNKSAKDYILGLFDSNDIVIICERNHGEMSQYDLITDVISDKRFIDKVGNIFTEIGVSSLNPALNIFLHTKNLAPDTVDQRIINFQRNCSFWPVWSNKNYSYLLHTLYSINNSLPSDKCISAFPSDLPFTWTGADSSDMVKLKTMLPNRDSIMASQIIIKFNEIKRSGQKRKKALVIMNFRHAFKQEFFIDGHSLKNTAYFLSREYGNRVANVLLNTVGMTNNGFTLLQEGKWDAAFKILDKENVGFSFNGAPFGKDSFDLWPYKTNFTYADIFTGFAFYLPIEKHHMVEGYPGLVDQSYRNELMNRIDLICIVGGEFLKMKNLKQALQIDNSFLNTEQDRKYYELDSLTNKRASWIR
jgi:hypothetical protein